MRANGMSSLTQTAFQENMLEAQTPDPSVAHTLNKTAVKVITGLDLQLQSDQLNSV